MRRRLRLAQLASGRLWALRAAGGGAAELVGAAARGLPGGDARQPRDAGGPQLGAQLRAQPRLQRAVRRCALGAALCSAVRLGVLVFQRWSVVLSAWRWSVFAAATNEPLSCQTNLAVVPQNTGHTSMGSPLSAFFFAFVGRPHCLYCVSRAALAQPRQAGGRAASRGGGLAHGPACPAGAGAPHASC